MRAEVGTHERELDALLRPGAAPRPLRELAFPAPLRMLVLAPHPDDFDAIACTLRHLHRQGHALQVAVLTTGASGVDEGFSGTGDAASRAALREREQRASAASFGLPPEHLHFLRLWEDEAAAAADQARLQAWLARHPAELLFLPHGNDSNRTHRRTFEAVSRALAALGRPAWALLNQDAKTVQMRVDLFFDFGADEAQWKGGLLRLHASQQARNLRTRGEGFDARVLQLNRRAAEALGTREAHAEVFELARLGGSP